MTQLKSQATHSEFMIHINATICFSSCSKHPCGSMGNKIKNNKSKLDQNKEHHYANSIDELTHYEKYNQLSGGKGLYTVKIRSETVCCFLNSVFTVTKSCLLSFCVFRFELCRVGLKGNSLHQNLNILRAILKVCMQIHLV